MIIFIIAAIIISLLAIGVYTTFSNQHKKPRYLSHSKESVSSSDLSQGVNGLGRFKHLSPKKNN